METTNSAEHGDEQVATGAHVRRQGAVGDVEGGRRAHGAIPAAAIGEPFPPSARGRLWMPRSRGALAGSLLILLGIWGAIVPFVGPEFGYATINHAAWSFTWGRLYLDVLPGAAAIIGGILLVATRNRLLGSIAGWLATAGGVWLVVGPEISRLWNHGVTAAGTYLGATWHQVAEAMGYHDGLGVIVTIIAALALGRLATRSRRELRLAGDETLVGRRPLHAHETELDAGGWRAVG